MSKLKKKPIVLFVPALIVLYIIIYIIPTVTGALVSSYTVEYGEMKVFDETTAYLVRDEKVYTAGGGGRANRYIENGTLVRKGTAIMEVSGGADSEIDSRFTDLLTRLSGSEVSTNSYTVKDGGVVSYYADGYESRLTPKTMEKGDYSYYSKISEDNVADLKRKNIAEGEPVFRIVDRTEWYIVCFVPVEHLDRYEEGNDVTAEFEDDSVEAEVYSVSKDKDGEHGRVILSVGNYYENYTKTRACPVSLVTYDEKGLLLENDSITEEDGQKGVYVRNKTGDYYFVPVKIYATDGEFSLAADTMYFDENGEQLMTVEIYDEILKNPK